MIINLNKIKVNKLYVGPIIVIRQSHDSFIQLSIREEILKKKPVNVLVYLLYTLVIERIVKELSNGTECCH